MNRELDQHELQRLLDGNIPKEDLELIFQLADDAPANWRRIAIGFIEEQMLRKQLRMLSDTKDLGIANSVNNRTKESRRRRGRFIAKTVATGCLVGVAMWIGRISVTPLQVPTSDGSQTGNYTIVLAPQETGDSVQSDRPKAAKTILASADVSDNELDRIGLQKMFTPLFDQESHVVFEENGYSVSEKPVIYIVHGNEGERFVIPQRQFSLVANHHGQ